MSKSYPTDYRSEVFMKWVGERGCRKCKGEGEGEKGMEMEGERGMEMEGERREQRRGR